MPSTASTITPCMSACCLTLALSSLASTPWISHDSPSSTGTAITSTQPSGPAVMKVIAMNRNTNGRSVSVDSVAEALKSRTVSICVSWCVKLPDESGRFSSRRLRAFLNRMLPSIRSAFLPARSSRWLRSWRASKSKTRATNTPAASDHSVTSA